MAQRQRIGARPKIVNRSGYILGDNGQRVYGMDAEHTLRMRAKEDPEWNKKVYEWVRDTSGIDFDVENAFEALRSGEILCELVNKMKPGTIKVINKSDPSKDHVALASMENIKLYLGACLEVGVPAGDIFLPDDLRTGRGMRLVCQNLASLSRTMQSDHGWEGPIVGPKLATQGPKTWKDVEVNASMFVDEYAESDMEAALIEYRQLLDEEKERVVRAMSGRALLEQEVAKLKQKVQEKDTLLREAQEAANIARKPLSDHGAAVARSSTPELERKRNASRKSAYQLRAHEEKSASNINEWQSKLNDIKAKNQVKRERRMSFGSTLDEEEEEEDDERAALVGGRPRKSRFSRIWVSRRTLKITIVVEFCLLVGVTLGLLYYAEVFK